MNGYPDTITILDDRAQFLAGRGHNYTSQFGEDGLIAALFERIGIRNRWCFEVGAADGLFFSNTKRLRDEGWEAVLIEGDEDKFEKLFEHAGDHIYTVKEWICPDSLDLILATAGAPTDLDLGVIDIDGQDYWVWKGMQTYRPRVILIEYSPYGLDDYLVPEGEAGQAGIDPIVRLGEAKGYTALCRTFCNVLFVEKQVWGNRSLNR